MPSGFENPETRFCRATPGRGLERGKFPNRRQRSVRASANDCAVTAL